MLMFSALLLLFAGVYFSFRTGFVQVRRFFRAMRVGGGAAGSGRGVSPFQAAATSLSATIGTGNIAGVAGAILLGGPGAVFWMWVSAFFGMALKAAEILIMLRFRGSGVGSPMRAIVRALPKRMHFLAGGVAFCGMLASVGMGDLVQVNALAESVQTLAKALDPAIAPARLRLVSLLTGVAVAAAIATASLGGAKRVGRIAALLVPAMSLLYVVFSFIVIGMNLPRVPGAFALILRAAFSPRAALGGAGGITVAAVIRTGIVRGVFTHEAGLGTAALAHGEADARDLSAQSLYGVFEVFFDTLLLCTLTALAILVSGVPLDYGSAAENGALVIRAFATVFGMRLSAVALSVSLFLFAFSSMLAFALYGTKCAVWLFGQRAYAPFLIVFLTGTVLGSVMELSLAWRIAEFVNALMALPNLAGMLLAARRMDLRI